MRKRLAILSLGIIMSISGMAQGQLDRIREAFVDATLSGYIKDENVTERLIGYSDYGMANDALMNQLYNNVSLPDHEVRRLVGLFTPEGTFSDIDYADRTKGRWHPGLHMSRIFALTRLYASPESAWYRDKEIGTFIHKGLQWWHTNHPICPNWWHNEIGVPKKMVSAMLLIKDELSEEEVAGGLKVLELSKIARTGQNRVWLAGINLLKGLLIDDKALVGTARDAIAEEIRVTSEEGVQEDWSFHQHGPQIQFGNYGLVYAECMASWIRVLDGSEYAFTDEQYAIVDNLIRNGISWSVWEGLMDPSYCGRQIFPDAGRGKAAALAIACMNMASVGRNAKEYTRLAQSLLYPGKYGNPLKGSRYFHRSDCGIYRTGNWYASVRMHSERTVGYEYTNQENTLANFSADGALLLMQHGREYEDIFAHWDWRMIPGTTAYDDGKTLIRNKRSENTPQAKRNNSSHVGGFIHEDIMCSTIEIDRQGLHALKSVFIFDDAVLALGTDIHADDSVDFKRITTAVDQTHLAGTPVVSAGRVWHDGRMYLSLDGKQMHVSTEKQRGLWDHIDPFFKGKWQEGEVFRCWFEHDPTRKDNSYAYAIIPLCRSHKTAVPKLKVLRNDNGCQAVMNGKDIAAVFHKAGSYTIGDHTIHTDTPAFCIIRNGKVVRAGIDTDHSSFKRAAVPAISR